MSSIREDALVLAAFQYFVNNWGPAFHSTRTRSIGIAKALLRSGTCTSTLSLRSKCLWGRNRLLVGWFDVSAAGEMIQHFWTRRPIWKVSGVSVSLTRKHAFSTMLACLCVSCHSRKFFHQRWHVVARFGLNESHPDAVSESSSLFSVHSSRAYMRDISVVPWSCTHHWFGVVLDCNLVESRFSTHLMLAVLVVLPSVVQDSCARFSSLHVQRLSWRPCAFMDEMFLCALSFLILILVRLQQCGIHPVSSYCQWT